MTPNGPKALGGGVMAGALENNGNSELNSMNTGLVKTTGNFPFASANERQCNLRTRTSLNLSLNRD